MGERRLRVSMMQGCSWCRVEELAEGVYAVIDKDGGWFRNNSGLVDMGGYTIIIDTQYNEERTRDLLRIKEQLGLPEKCILVNTHHHGDHTWGNHLADCITLMHKRALEAVKLLINKAPEIYKPFFPNLDFKGSKYTLPEAAVEGEVHLIGGDREAMIMYVGPAHTVGDIMVELPGEKIIFAGDIVFNGVIPLALDGTVKGWINILDRLLQDYSGYKIIGGHGPIAELNTIDKLKKYFKHLLGGTNMLLQENLRDPYEISLHLTNGPLEEWKERGRLVLNVARAIMDLRKLPPGAPPENLPYLATKMYEFEKRK